MDVFLYFSRFDYALYGVRIIIPGLSGLCLPYSQNFCGYHNLFRPVLSKGLTAEPRYSCGFAKRLIGGMEARMKIYGVYGMKRTYGLISFFFSLSFFFFFSFFLFLFFSFSLFFFFSFFLFL